MLRCQASDQGQGSQPGPLAVMGGGVAVGTTAVRSILVETLLTGA